MRIVLLPLFVCLLCFLNCESAFSQSTDYSFTNKGHHEIELGYGTPPLIIGLVRTIPGSKDLGFTPINFHLQYMYNISKHFSIGASLSETAAKRTEQIGCIIDDKMEHVLTFGIVGRAYWFYKNHFAMYSKYGVTLSGSNNDSFSSLFFCPLNLSLVGIEYGGKKWRVYCEPLSFISMWPSAQAGVKLLF